MREVDRALARAYAQRGDVVPPPPHLIPRAAGPAIDGGPAVPETRRPAGVVLEWPPVVLTLERDYGDRFDLMAESLAAAGELRGRKVQLFTSCHRAEGRTTLVLALARALARRRGRVLLVDADLAGPMLARQLGLRPRLGLDDVVEQGQALDDALIDAPDDHLHVLPLRSAVTAPRGFFKNAEWVGLVGRLRREFDLVLVDGGPLFAGLGAAVLHRSVDAAVLVYNPSMTGERSLRRARQTLEAAGVPLLGLAETFVA